MKLYDTCIEEGSSTIYPAFEGFLNQLIESLIEKQQRDDQNLMNEWFFVKFHYMSIFSMNLTII